MNNKKLSSNLINYPITPTESYGFITLNVGGNNIKLTKDSFYDSPYDRGYIYTSHHNLEIYEKYIINGVTIKKFKNKVNFYYKNKHVSSVELVCNEKDSAKYVYEILESIINDLEKGPNRILGKGLREQMEQSNTVLYNQFSMKDLEEVIEILSKSTK